MSKVLVMLFYEEENKSEVEEVHAEEKEETTEEEEEGELVIEQLKLLINVSKTWQKVLQGQESIEVLKSLFKPLAKAVPAITTVKSKTKTTKKKPRPRSRKKPQSK